MNSLVKEYRDHLTATNQTDPRPDWLLTREFGKLAEQGGKLAEYRNKYPDWADQYGQYLDQSGPGFAGRVKNAAVRGYESGMQGLEAAAAGGGAAEDIAARQKIIDKNKPGRDVSEFQDTEGFGNSLLRFAKDPIDITAEVIAESLGQSWPSIVGGVVGGVAGGKAAPGNKIAQAAGTAIGAGSGSALVEYSSKVLSSMQDAGMDMRDPASIRQFFSDPELLSKARTAAVKRAIPVGVFDAITAGLAGRFMGPLKGTGAGVKEVLKATAKEVGQQAAGGMAGEALGQVAADEKTDPKAIFLEGIAEVGSAPSEIYSNIRETRPEVHAAASTAAQPAGPAPVMTAPATTTPTTISPNIVDPSAQVTPTLREQVDDEKRRLAALEPKEQLAELVQLRAVPAPTPVQAEARAWLESLKLDAIAPVEEAAPADEVSAPAAAVAKPPAPAEFLGMEMADAPGGGFETYRLTEDIPGHGKGSSVSRATLEQAGYEVPATPAPEAAPTWTAKDRSKALKKLNTAMTQNRRSLDPTTRDLLKTQLLAVSQMDNPAAVEALNGLITQVTNAGTQDAEARAAVAAGDDLPAAEPSTTATPAIPQASAREQAQRYKALRGATKLTPEETTELTQLQGQVTQRSIQFQELNAAERTPEQEAQRQELKKWLTAMGHKPSEKETKPVASTITPVPANQEVERTTGFKQGAINDGYVDFSNTPQIQTATPEQLIASEGEYSKQITEGQGTKNDSARQSKVAMAFLMPDGSVAQRGIIRLTSKQPVTSVGDAPVNVSDGVAVQMMGKGKMKAVDATGSKPVLLRDLFAAGAKPLGLVRFSGEPTFIREDFANVNEWRKALDMTPKQAVQAAPTIEAAPVPVATPAAGRPVPAATPVATAPAPGAVVATPDLQARVKALAKKAGIVEGGETPNKRQLALFDKLLAKEKIKIGDAAEFLSSKIFASGDDATAAAEAAGARATGSAEAEIEIQQAQQRIETIESELENNDNLSEAMRQILRDERKELKQGITEAQQEQSRQYRQLSEDPTNPNRPLTAAQVEGFQRVVQSLSNLGLAVETQREITRQVGDELHKVAGYYNQNANIIRIAIGDTTAGSLDNFQTLFHEVGHYVMAQLTPEMQHRLQTAALFTMDELTHEANYYQDGVSTIREERLVETFAKKLAEQGFGKESPSIAARIVRTVKALYLRAMIALRTAFNGGGPNVVDPTTDKLALAWFENQMKRALGGDFDASYMDFLAIPETTANLMQKFEKTSLRGQPNVIFPWARAQGVQQPEVLPDTVGAADESLRYRDIYGGEFKQYPAAMARVNVALQKEITTVLEALFTKFKSKDQTIEAFWKNIAGTADLPTEIAKKMEQRFPGSMAADKTNLESEAMQDRFSRLLGQVTRKLANRARKTAVDLRQRARTAGDVLVKDARKYADVERLYKSADFMDAHFMDKVQEMVRGLRKDVGAMTDLATTSGQLDESIKNAEQLIEGEEIPADYQRVFQNVLARKIPVFDYMQGLARLNLDYGTMAVPDIIKAINENAPQSAVLRQLQQNKPLALALATLARNSAQEMNLLQLRVSTDTVEAVAINKELEEIRGSSKERIAELAGSINEGIEARSLKDRLKRDYVLSRNKRNRLLKLIDTNTTKAAQADESAKGFDVLHKENEKTLGAFSDWEPADNSTYLSMQEQKDGTWKAVRKTLRMTGPDTLLNAGAVMDDVQQNSNWLQGHEAEKDSRLYNEVARHTTEIGLLQLGKNYDTNQAMMLMKILAPLGEKFSSTNTLAGKNIQRRLNRFAFITRSHQDATEAASRKWSKSFTDVVKATGFENNRHFLSEIYDPLMFAIESEPGIETDAQLYNFAAGVVRELLPDGAKIAPDFNKKLADFLNATKNVSESLRKIAEVNGVFVEDPTISDPLRMSPTGKSSQGTLRYAISQGWLTVPRRLDRSAVQAVVHTMKKAGWSPQAMQDLARLVTDKTNPMPVEALTQVTAKLFTPEVNQKFLTPFMNKPGRPIFKGPLDSYGDRPRIDQTTVRDVWAQSNNDILQFVDNLFKATNEKESAADLQAFAGQTLRTIGALYRMELRLVNDGETASRVRLDNTARSHTVMDARTNEIIPPEHFNYLPFDASNTRVRLSEVAYHAAFGRDGKGVNQDLAAIESELGTLGLQYERISRLPKADQAIEYAGLNIDPKKAKKAYKSMQAVRGWEQELNLYFSGGNQLGARGETGAALEALRSVVFGVLNQFSTAFWNVVSVGDPTLVFRSLGPQSVGTSLRAAGNVFYNSAGSMFEAFGMNALKAGEYSKELGNFIDMRNTERLPMGVFLADIGKDGRYQDGFSERFVQLNRAAQQAFRKGISNVATPEFATFNAIWSPLNFFSTQTHHAIALSTINTFETMVRKAIQYYEQNPAAKQAAAMGRFTFTPEMLGMDGPVFFNDKGTFDFFMEKLGEYRMGDLPKIALDAMPKMQRGERLLTNNQAMSIGMMALNEMSLESNVNTRPIGLINSKFAQWVAPLLGWPLSKMNQVHRALSEQDGRTNLQTAMTGLGVIAMWSIPVGLAFSLGMDKWDEDVLKKKSARRNINPLAAVPVIGPAFYANSMSSAAAALERISRAGTYGLGGDLANSMTNVIDPKSGQRDFDLNSRVLVFSMFANMRDAVRNLVQQEGAATYSSVWRPLMMSVGGNGLIQYQQILNNMLDLDNSEARVTKRINVGNWIRPASRDAELELKSGEGRSSPTPVSVQVREMQLASLANDPSAFLESFRLAVEAAAKRGEADPERYVYASYMTRHPVNSLLAHKPSDMEMARLNAALGDEGRLVVAEATALFDRYAAMIKPAPKERGDPTNVDSMINRAMGPELNRMKQEMNPRAALFSR